MSGKSAKPYAEAALCMVAHIRENRPVTQEEMVADPDRWDAACARVQVLGEQVVQIDNLFQTEEDSRQRVKTRWLASQYPEYDDLLASLAGTRNVISHNYITVEAPYVWYLYFTRLDDIEDLFLRIAEDCGSW